MSRLTVLADTGHQPRLVLAWARTMCQLSLKASPWSKREVFDTPRNGKGGVGAVGTIVDAVELHVKVIDVGGLEAVTQVSTLALEELEHLRCDELCDLVHFIGIPVLLQRLEVAAGCGKEALLVEQAGALITGGLWQQALPNRRRSKV